MTCWVLVLILQQYDQELFKLALPCLSAVAGALPPDHMESSSMDMIEKQSCVDAERNFTPRPADTTRYVTHFADGLPLAPLSIRDVFFPQDKFSNSVHIHD